MLPEHIRFSPGTHKAGTYLKENEFILLHSSRHKWCLDGLDLTTFLPLGRTGGATKCNLGPTNIVLNTTLNLTLQCLGWAWQKLVITNQQKMCDLLEYCRFIHKNPSQQKSQVFPPKLKHHWRSSQNVSHISNLVCFSLSNLPNL